LANFAKSDHTAGYIELLEDEKETSVSFFLSPREKEMEVSFLVIVHQTQCDQIGQFATHRATFLIQWKNFKFASKIYTHIENFDGLSKAVAKEKYLVLTFAVFVGVLLSFLFH